MRRRATFAAAPSLRRGCPAAPPITARPVEGAEPPAHPAGVLQMVWRTTLHEHGLFEPAPEECATGALANGHLVIGSRASSVVGVAPDTGHVDWVTGVSGGVDSTARFDRAHGQVYVGADDGTFYAFDPASGAIRWTYHGKGAFERAPELGADLVYAASATDRVVALDPATGKWRWQYEREMPEGFTIHGYAGPRLHGNELLAGFADGYFVSLGAASGEVLWARSLATASEQFVDVDTTPALAGQPRLRGVLLGRPLRRRSARRRHQVAPAASRGSATSAPSTGASSSWRPGRGCTPPISTGTSSGARG